MKMDAKVKAELIAAGCADVDESLLRRETTSASGPSAGLRSFFFRSGKHRVRLNIDKDSPLKVIKEDKAIIILNNDKEIVRGEIEDALLHCPEQAYITLSERCIFDCKFCPVPLLNGRIKTMEEVIRMVEDAKKTGKMRAISITSGVEISPKKEVVLYALLKRWKNTLFR
jgi:biotin synthase-related radical SAM superfamily protein